MIFHIDARKHTMKISILVISLVSLICVEARASEPSMVTHFSKKDALTQLIQELDLASFRSSLGPRRDQQHRTLSAFNFTRSERTDTKVTLEDEGFTYRIEVLQRGDLNKDGIEDLEVCFSERAKQGSYHAQQAMLVTKYSAKTPVLALKFGVDGCATFAK